MKSKIQVLNPQSIRPETHPEVAVSKEGGVGGSPVVGIILPLINSTPSQPNSVAPALALGNGSHPEEWLLSGS